MKNQNKAPMNGARRIVWTATILVAVLICVSVYRHATRGDGKTENPAQAPIQASAAPAIPNGQQNQEAPRQVAMKLPEATDTKSVVSGAANNNKVKMITFRIQPQLGHSAAQKTNSTAQTN